MPIGSRTRTVVAAALVAASAAVAPPAGAASEVDRAQAAVVEAQRRAARAVQGLQAAEAALEDSEESVGKARTEVEAARRRRDDAAGQLRAAAVDAYAGLAGPALVQASDVAQLGRAEAYLAAASGASITRLDELRASAVDLERSERALTARVQAQRSRLQAFERLERDLATNLDRVGAELERAKVREAEAKERAAKAAAADKARLEAEARAAEEARRRLEAARDEEARKTRPKPPAAAPPANRGPWQCPVQGGASFTNDWGFPRSSGRRHQGNDLFAPRGTPVVASVSGTWTRNSNRLGGTGYFLRGDDGNTYYGTHMSGWSSTPPGRVAAGTVLGFVGTSGNARGTAPHLHFEIHPGGGGPVNPYPTVSRHC